MSTTYVSGPATGTSRTSGISSQSVANNKAYLGAAIDNSVNLDAIADIELVWSFGVAPNGTSPLQVFLLYAQDGTNYEDGLGDGSSTTTVPSLRDLIGVVTPPADTSTHRERFADVVLAPYKFKVLVYNAQTGQTATVTVNVATRKDQTVG